MQSTHYKLQVAEEYFTLEHGLRLTKFNPKDLSEIEFSLPAPKAKRLHDLLEPSDTSPVSLFLWIANVEIPLREYSDADIRRYKLEITEIDSSADPWHFKSIGNRV